jgi:hypothetical protein
MSACRKAKKEKKRRREGKERGEGEREEGERRKYLSHIQAFMIHKHTHSTKQLRARPPFPHLDQPDDIIVWDAVELLQEHDFLYDQMRKHIVSFCSFN